MEWFDASQSNKFRNMKRVLVKGFHTVLSMTSESTVSDNWMENEWRLQFYNTVISCQKGINCPVSLYSWSLWSVNWSDTENECLPYILCGMMILCSPSCQASCYLHWEIYLEISFCKKWRSLDVLSINHTFFSEVKFWISNQRPTYLEFYSQRWQSWYCPHAAIVLTAKSGNNRKWMVGQVISTGSQ